VDKEGRNINYFRIYNYTSISHFNKRRISNTFNPLNRVNKMKEIEYLIEKYNNEAIGYEVAFLNSNGTISLYDEEDLLKEEVRITNSFTAGNYKRKTSIIRKIPESIKIISGIKDSKVELTIYF